MSGVVTFQRHVLHACWATMRVDLRKSSRAKFRMKMSCVVSQHVIGFFRRCWAGFLGRDNQWSLMLDDTRLLTPSLCTSDASDAWNLKCMEFECRIVWFSTDLLVNCRVQPKSEIMLPKQCISLEQCLRSSQCYSCYSLFLKGTF